MMQLFNNPLRLTYKETLKHTIMSTGKRIYRSDDRILGGVCAGLAEYFEFDATWVRILYALLTFCTAFSGCILYIIMWIVIPDKNRLL
jgi:phage shock protein PspC (stress-responsive transcriptional regulator)